MDNDELWCRFNDRAPNLKDFLKWPRAADAPSNREIVPFLADNANHRGKGKDGIAKEVKATMLKEGDDVILRKLGTAHVHQILRATFAVRTNEMKKIGIFYMFL